MNIEKKIKNIKPNKDELNNSRKLDAGLIYDLKLSIYEIFQELNNKLEIFEDENIALKNEIQKLQLGGNDVI